MSDKTNLDLPDPRRRHALENWLAYMPRQLIVATAFRSALTLLPWLGSRSAESRTSATKARLALATFRALAAAFVWVRFPSNETRQAAWTASAHASLDMVATSAFSAARMAFAEGDQDREALFVSASYSLKEVDEFAPGLVEKELQKLAQLAHNNGSAEYLLLYPLWSLDRNPALPIDAQLAWTDLRHQLAELKANWDVWLDWAEARFRGGPDWPKAVYDELTKWREEWDRDPALVNADIKALLARERLKTQGADAQSELLELTRQQPASFEFWEEAERVYARAVPSPPFNSEFAQTLINELQEKCESAARALTENNADETIRNAVSRLAGLLDKPAAELEAARVLSRTLTVESHRDALFDPKSESERSIRAMVDDVAITARTLLALYPDIERINARLLAVELQPGKAQVVEASLRGLEAQARKANIADQTALDALSEGRIDFDELGRKAMVVSIEASAKYIEAQARIVSARLLNALNFMSSMVKPYVLKGASYAVGVANTVGEETWRDAKKLKDKAVDGIGEGLKTGAKVVTIGAILYFATEVLPVWTSISANAPTLSRYVELVAKALEEATKPAK